MTIVAALGSVVCVAHGADDTVNPFDGRWSVVLECDDTTDRNGPVKGYVYRFFVSIHEGAVDGEYGAPGHPASVHYAGRVGDDGTLELEASGNTGRSDYSVGKVPQGTVYGYTLQGRLTASAGQATRREVRPCTATFTRQ